MKVRKISITLKLIIAVVVLFIISDVILAIVTYNKSSAMLMAQIKSDNEKIAKSVAMTADGSIVASVNPGEENTEDYLKVSNMLTSFLETTEKEYIYILSDRRQAAEWNMR